MLCFPRAGELHRGPLVPAARGRRRRGPGLRGAQAERRAAAHGLRGRPRRRDRVDGRGRRGARAGRHRGGVPPSRPLITVRFSARRGKQDGKHPKRSPSL